MYGWLFTVASAASKLQRWHHRPADRRSTCDGGDKRRPGIDVLGERRGQDVSALPFTKQCLPGRSNAKFHGKSRLRSGSR